MSRKAQLIIAQGIWFLCICLGLGGCVLVAHKLDEDNARTKAVEIRNSFNTTKP